MNKHIDMLADAIRNKQNIYKHNIFDLGDTLAKRHFLPYFGSVEYCMGNLLYKMGLDVPIQYFCLQFSLGKIGRFGPFSYTIMEHIEGIPLSEPDNPSCAIAMYKEELKKVMSFGICPYDCDNLRNGIYSPKEDKVYLLDFELWSMGSKRELDHYRHILENDMFFVH